MPPAGPDYFLATGPAACSPCVTQNTGFAWDHGDYAAEIDTNWLGIVGPGVAHLGLDGPAPASAAARRWRMPEPGVRITGAPGRLAARTLRDEGCLPWPR